MSNKVFIWSLVAAFSGFLFGFDTAVISGAEKAVQQAFSSNDLVHGIAISAALWGTVIGAMFGTIPNDKVGRKTTLVVIGMLYLLSALLSAIAWDVNSFTVARFIGGLGVGASTIAAPGYIAEIAPANRRGRLVVLYQLSLVVGIFAAYLSNFMIGGMHADDWRWMLGVEALPALLFLLLTFVLPESPRWLLQIKGDKQKAIEILKKLGANTAHELSQLTVEKVKTGQPRLGVQSLFYSALRKPIALAFLLGLFNQLSGINAIIYYAPRILGMTGSSESAALLATVGIGAVNIVFTAVGMYLIDRVGRRSLMIVGSLGYIVSLSLVAWNFYIDVHAYTPIFLFVFIASHAVGQGAVIWVYIAEIFPTEFRSLGQSIGSSTHWCAAAILAFAMPQLLNGVEPTFIFGAFAIFMVLQLLYAFKLMIETKGRSLECIQQEMQGNSHVNREING